MFRKAALLLVTALVVATPAGARAQTNYPVEATVEVRDGNGNLVSAGAGVFPGDPLNIASGGWQGGATVTFTFLSDPILLGSRVADAQGVVRATFPVPNVEPGMHTLRLQGAGANGQPRTVDWPVRVLARPASVAGATQDRPASGSGTATGAFGRTGAFGKTGLSSAEEFAQLGFALFAVGAALVIAVRKSRRTGATL